MQATDTPSGEPQSRRKIRVVVVGGTIPGDDIPELKKAGVAEVFTPGASTQEIIEYVRQAVGRE